jgi:hypothetical protein
VQAAFRAAAAACPPEIPRLLGTEEIRGGQPRVNEEDLNYLKAYTARQSHQFAVEATFSYDSNDEFMDIEVVTRAGGGEPRSVKRSGKFQSRAQAEAFIEHAIRTAR